MKKAPFVKKCIKGLLVIGMAVQICFGLIWMGANLFSMQTFSESAEYIEVSKSFVLDEYTGILYPVLLFLLRSVFGENMCYTVLYLLQLAAAFFSGCFFLKLSGLGKEKLCSGRNVCGSLYLMTVPFVMQLHLAVLPISLVSSLFLLQLAICFKIYRKTEAAGQKNSVILCLLWVLMSLFLPDYLWLGAVPLLWCLVLGLVRKWKGKEKLFLIAGMVAVVLVTGTVNTFAIQPGSRGKIQRSFGAAMVSRLAWPHFEANYYFWPEEVKVVMPQMTAREVDRYADNVKLVLGPLLENAFGKEQADAYYLQMAWQCFTDRTKEILPGILEDFTSYLFTPFAIDYQLSGGGYSYSGWNFDRMWEQGKILTGYYVKHSLNGFMVGFVILLASLIGQWPDRKKRVDGAGLFLLCVVCALTQTIWYTMSGACMMDYKNVPVIVLLWYACVLLGLKKLTGEETC